MGKGDLDTPDGDPRTPRAKLDAERLKKRDRMKKWARSRSEFGLGNPPTKKRGDAEADDPRARHEAWCAPDRLARRLVEVGTMVQEAGRSLPPRLRDKAGLQAEFDGLDRAVTGAGAAPLSARADIAKRLDELAIDAGKVQKMADGDDDLLEWGVRNPGRGKAQGLDDALDALETACADRDPAAYAQATQALLSVRAEWDYALAEWARLEPLARLAPIAERLPPQKDLQKLLDTLKKLPSVAMRLPNEKIYDGSWVAVRAYKPPLEACAAALGAVPKLLETLVAADKAPVVGSWPERDRLRTAIAAAIGTAAKDALRAAADELDSLVRLAEEAVVELRICVDGIDQAMSVASPVLKLLDKATASQFPPRAPERLELMRKKAAAALAAALVPAAPRADLRRDVEIHVVWAQEIADATVSNADLLADLAWCFVDANRKQMSGDTLKTRLVLASAFDKKIDATQGFGAGIANAYAALLRCKGVWQERMKKSVAGQAMTGWLVSEWNYPNDDATAVLGSMIAACNSKAGELFDRAGIDVTLFNDLRAHFPVMAQLVRTVVEYPDAVKLRQLADDFLPFAAVTAANFETLVARNQVDLYAGGYRNPFKWYCSNHGMYEAEGKLDVSWRHSNHGNPLFWGVVHVHYHGRTVTTPNAQTYYHVKATHHGPPLNEEVTAGGAIGAIDAALPAGAAMPP